MSPQRENLQLRRTARRLGLQAGALIVVCLLAVALVQWILIERSASSAVVSRLADVTASIDKPTEAPRDVFVTIANKRETISSPNLPIGFPVEEDLASVARTGVARERSLSVDGHEYLVRTERSGTRVVQAAIDRQPIEDESRRLIIGLLWAGLFGVVLAALLAFWLARRAVGPMAGTMALQRRFVADASHELRTPLTLLSTRVQLLARKVDNPQRRGEDISDDVRSVLADTKNLTDLLDELLLAADTRESAAREVCDLTVLAREVVHSAQAEAQALGLEISLHSTGVTTVVASVPGLRRALVALLDNALDHAVHRVEVHVHKTRRHVIARVADDGPGISPEVIPRMFERFSSSRAPNELATRRHYGLGLALVSDVANAHGGKVNAANSSDGAVISLELPAHR